MLLSGYEPRNSTATTTPDGSNTSAVNAASNATTAETVGTAWCTRLIRDTTTNNSLEEVYIDCAATAHMVTEPSKFADAVVNLKECEV